MKLAVVQAILLTPVLLYFLPGDNSLAWQLCEILSIPILLAIYFFDRIVLAGTEIKFRYSVILFVQTLLILSTLAFAGVYKHEADRQKDFSIRLQQETEGYRIERVELEQQLRELQSLKKK